MTTNSGGAARSAGGPPHPREVERCRCGARRPSGASAEEPLDVRTPLLRARLSGLWFCSPTCLRAFLLEDLERVEGSVAPWVVGEPERLAWEIRELLQAMESQRLAESYGPTAGSQRPPR